VFDPPGYHHFQILQVWSDPQCEKFNLMNPLSFIFASAVIIIVIINNNI